MWSVAQLCQTLCSPLDCSWSDCSVRGIFQPKLVECITISSSRGSSQHRDWNYISYIASGLKDNWNGKVTGVLHFFFFRCFYSLALANKKDNQLSLFAWMGGSWVMGLSGVSRAVWEAVVYSYIFYINAKMSTATFTEDGSIIYVTSTSLTKIRQIL